MTGIENFFLSWPYLAIFAYLVLCGVGFPGAEEIALLAGGWVINERVAAGANAVQAWSAMLGVIFAGIFAGDSVLFLLGQRYGRRVRLFRPFRRILRPRRMRRVGRFYERYGSKAIFLGRFLPGIRAPAFFTAGLSGMKFWRFFLWNGLAAILSVPVGVGIGYVFGRSAGALLRRIDLTIGGALLLAFVVFLFVRKRSAARRAQPPPPPAPSAPLP